MNNDVTSIPLDDGLNLRELVTTGSVLHINEDYEDREINNESENIPIKTSDMLGEPVASFKELEQLLSPVDDQGLVKKKILEEGGGLPLHLGCTVSVLYAGYWEGSSEPFDVTKDNKPLVVDLQDTGLLPGLEIAIKSMLVGETAMFLLNYKLMFGELGIPPRIKPKANCVFYINVIKSILTPKEGHMDLSEKNMFHRVHTEVKMLYTSGVTLHKAKNFPAAIQLFRKGVTLLHKCRLADEEEEKIQQKLLIKLYLNLAISYNKTKQPLKACIQCNELNRLNSLWNNGNALFQNAKALIMIGQFNDAERRLQRALKLSPNNKEIISEIELLISLKETCNKTKLLSIHSTTISDNFKEEVDKLIKNFKENCNLFKLSLPEGLNDTEMQYIKEVCEKENLFCNKIQKQFLLDKEKNVPLAENELNLFL